MQNIIDRIANEPALVVAVIMAVGALIGQDLTELASFVESAVVLAAGVVVRQRVVPTRKLISEVLDGE